MCFENEEKVKYMKRTFLLVLALPVFGGVSQNARADGVVESHPFSISAPDFLIPMNGQVGILDIYTDGRPAETSGFNVLGHQKVFIPANGVSSGSLTLNLHFSGFTPEVPGTTVETVELQFTLRDLDTIPVQAVPGLMLQEKGSLTGINGVTLSNPFLFENFLPSGTTKTDGELITLEPFLLNQSALPGINFSEPFVLTFTFEATATSSGTRGYSLYNGPENLASGIRLSVVPGQVPEPSTVALLGMGALGLGVMFWRRRRI